LDDDAWVEIEPAMTEIQKTFQILPSLLSVDFARMGEQVRELEQAGCKLLHLDIMDGHFVPNLTMGPPVLKSLSASTGLEFDVHLMVTDPDKWTEAFDFPNTRCITLHAEAGYHLHRSLQKVRDQGKLAGLALNPATPLDVLEYLWPSLDLVLIMTVNPGFGGQSFIEACKAKIARASQLIQERTGGRVILEIDGGVGMGNLGELAGAGVQWAVTGNALFGQENLGQAFTHLQNIGSCAWEARKQR
jgi:ribulose-phosphate 3-epimerase